MTTLVLLPGLDGTGTLFGPLVEALAGKLRVAVLSYPVDRALGYDALEAIADAGLPPQGPLVLLGESFSGPLAVSIAARHPDRVVGLVLCCSFVRNPRPLLGFLRALLPFVPFGQVPLALMAAVLFGRFDTPSLRAGLARALAPVPAAVLRGPAAVGDRRRCHRAAGPGDVPRAVPAGRRGPPGARLGEPVPRAAASVG